MRHNRITPLVMILMITSVVTACMDSEINTTSPPTKTPLPSPEVQPSAESTITPPPLPTTLPPTPTLTPTPEPLFGLLPEGALARFGKGVSTSAALTPDGTLLAVGTTRGVYVYQVDTLEEVWSVETDIKAIGTLKVVADGTQLVAGHYQGVVVAWDVKTGEQLYTLATDAGFIPDISPDGKYLLALTEGDEWEVWDIAAGQPIRVLADGAAFQNPVVFSPDGSRIAGSIDGRLTVWDTTSWQEIDYPGVRGDVVDLAWSWDNSRLSVIAETNKDNIGYVLTETKSVSLKGEASTLDRRRLLGWAPDDSIVVTYQETGDFPPRAEVTWWNPGTGEPEHTLLLEDFPTITKIAYSPDIIAAANGLSGLLMVYDWTSGEVLHRSFEHATGVDDLAFSPDGTLLASAPKIVGGLSSGISVWDVETGARLQRIAEAYRSAAWSPDGILAAIGQDDTDGVAIILWEPVDGTVIQVFTPQSDSLVPGFDHVTWSPDGAQVAASTFWGSETFIWDVETGQQLLQIDGFNIHFSPDGAFIATGHNEADPGRRIIVRDRSTDDPLLTIFGGTAMDWSPDGRLLASADGVWEVATGQELYPLSGHTSLDVILAFSPDGSYLATGGWEDKQVIIWDAHTGEQLWTFTGHVWYLTSLAWFPDGSVLASGSEDGTIILWDISMIEP